MNFTCWYKSQVTTLTGTGSMPKPEPHTLVMSLFCCTLVFYVSDLPEIVILGSVCLCVNVFGEVDFFPHILL